jgi:hypothetical protein
MRRNLGADFGAAFGAESALNLGASIVPNFRQ